MLELKIGLEVYFYGVKFKFSFDLTVFKCVVFRWTNFSECIEQGFRGKTIQMSPGFWPQSPRGCQYSHY